MSLFFTADTHFFHEPMVARRAMRNKEHMNEVLINAWNSRVTNEDVIYFLGDFSFGRTDQTKTIWPELKGQIRFIRGNHDTKLKLPSYVQECKLIHELHKSKATEGVDAVLCHYPLETWNKMHYDAYMLHGHSHGSLPENYSRRRMDIGVDTRPDLAPWSLAEVHVLLANRVFVPVDHHGRKGHEYGDRQKTADEGAATAGPSRDGESPPQGHEPG